MDEVKKVKVEEGVCKLMPKIELHAHLNGSISLETLKELKVYNEQNGEQQIDEKKWEEWENKFLQPEILTFSDCFQIFELAHSVTITPKAVELATERVIEDFANDNVIYLELRSTLRKETNMTKAQYIESMISGVKNSRSKFNWITVKLIVSLNRKQSIKDAEENVDLAIEYSKIEPDVIVGIDLSGDPHQKTFSDYTEILNKARTEGLKITIHCAEIPGDKEVYDILNFHPDRLGHATCIHKSLSGNTDNWNLLLDSKIPVEICITSNVKCKTVPCVVDHHFQYLYNADHPIVICTDDKSVFQTSLSAEYELAKQTFELEDMDMWNLNLNAVDYAFADEDLKKRIKQTIRDWATTFLD